MSNQALQLVNSVQGKFVQIAQEHNLVTWQKESQFALQALQTNGTLATCAPETIQNAIINVASVGLTLNPADGYAYLVPEYSKPNKRNECQLRISFKGLIKLATDTGAIKWVKADVVKAADTFEYRGLNQMPEHKMNPVSDRGDSIGVYCVAKTNEDEYLVDMAPWDEVMKAKEAAKTKMVWDKWPDEMAKKFIIKRASKQWPKTEQSAVLHNAIDVINQVEGSVPISAYTADQKEAFDAMLEAEDSIGLELYYREFKSNDNEQTWVDLYNSGEQGQKVKLKGKVNELLRIGFELVQNVHDALDNDDNLAALECIDDITDHGKKLLWNALDTEEQTKLLGMIEKAA
ncbi:RecT family recombinase [Solemya elarraichensis gill symbiont]|uniref:Recombinase RecT n=1 Tax=Solemya elarraichensis gill symbiont TaxID=1918949 RepID=A0A1T2KUG1_9GAMM|nr:RecT family recombinase [Solemya elarraichensis gill symbiont]OOZ36499.1 hypothetical protein BOW52_10745 [Solemya elarraichensis gill symbiont]